MKRGSKPKLPGEKLAAGTYQPCRDAGVVEIREPGAELPQAPDTLTAAGRAVWADLIEHVAATKLATNADALMLGNLCNLQGAINKSWEDGLCPPMTALVEARRYAEQFGLFGARSRLAKMVVPAAGEPNGFRRPGRPALPPK